MSSCPCLLRKYRHLIVIREPSTNNGWRQKQRYTAKYWAKLGSPVEEREEAFYKWGWSKSQQRNSQTADPSSWEFTDSGITARESARD